MKKKGIIISIFSFIIVLSILLTFLLVNKKDTYYYDDKIISNSFEYEQSITNESIEDVYFYSDSYFKESSKLENEHLRTFALSLAVSFNPTYRKDKTNYNIDKILQELEFKDINYYDLEEFNKNTIGTSISHKKLNDKYELVVIVLRGSGYQGEWESNLDIGEDGNVKGFDDACKIVLSRLREYLKNNNINNYKLLVTGYSRAAAVSSLVGVYINNNLKDYNIDDSNLYVYAFESPRYSGENIIYENIHNVINKNDIVTYVYPKSWDLYHSGIDEDITTNSSKLQEKYLDILSNDIIKNKITIDKQKFIEKFINFLPKNRNDFYKINDSISNIFELLNNKTSYEKNKIIEFFKNIKIDFNLSNSITLFTLINSDDEKTIRNSFDSIVSSYDKEYSKIQNVLSKKEYNDLKDDLFDILLFLHPSIKSDYKSNDMFSISLTFIYNLEDIFKEHYFSTNFEQVKMKDSYYNEMP